MKEEEPYDNTPQEDDSPQAGGGLGSFQSYDDRDASLQSQQDDLAASGELTNAQIRQLDDEERRLAIELEALRGDIDQLCAQFNGLPKPKTIWQTAQEVAKDYLSEKNLTAQQAGAMLLKVLKCTAIRANVVTGLVDYGGRLVVKLIQRKKLLEQYNALFHGIIELGNRQLEIGSKRIDVAKERYRAMGEEFIRRHEQRQRDFENMLSNVNEESLRQWDEINKSSDGVESPRKSEIDDIINGFDNI